MTQINNRFIFDRITSKTNVSSVDHAVFSLDSVLIVFVSNNSSIPSVFYNGDSLRQLVSNSIPAGIFFSGIFYMANPPVGTYPLTTSVTSDVVAISVLGVNKKTNNFKTFSTNIVSSPSITFSINSQIANGLILTCVPDNSNSFIPNDPQVLIARTGFTDMTVSYAIGRGDQLLSWTEPGGSGSGNLCTVILESSTSSSIAYPNISLRRTDDVIEKNRLNVYPSQTGTFGYFPSNFFQNSFLHTIGRIINPPPPSPPIIPGGETPPILQTITSPSIHIRDNIIGY